MAGPSQRQTSRVESGDLKIPATERLWVQKERHEHLPAASPDVNRDGSMAGWLDPFTGILSATGRAKHDGKTAPITGIIPHKDETLEDLHPA